MFPYGFFGAHQKMVCTTKWFGLGMGLARPSSHSVNLEDSGNGKVQEVSLKGINKGELPWATEIYILLIKATFCTNCGGFIPSFGRSAGQDFFQKPSLRYWKNGGSGLPDLTKLLIRLIGKHFLVRAKKRSHIVGPSIP